MSLVATTFSNLIRSGALTLSAGNLTVTSTGNGGVATNRPCGGDVYFEVNVTSGSPRVGVCNALQYGSSSAGYNYGISLGTDNWGLGYDASSGNVYVNNSSVKSLPTFTAGDVIGVALSVASGLLWFRKNGGNWNNDVIGNQNPVSYVGGLSIAGLSGNSYWPVVSFSGSGALTAVFDHNSWGTAAPTGYTDLSGVTIVGKRGNSPTSIRSNPGPVAAVPKRSAPSKVGAKMFTAGAAGSRLGAGVSISGVVQENSVNVAKKVLVYDNATYELLECVTSDPTTGAFTALCHARGKVFAVAFDPNSYQAQVFDRITPA